MAITKMGSIVGAISGSVGGSTFGNNRNGSYLAQRPRKTNKRTSQQLRNRKAYAQYAAMWRTLDEETRQAWRRTAATFTEQNRLGVARHLSGFQLFLQQALACHPADIFTGEAPFWPLPVPNDGVFTVDFSLSTGFNITVSYPFPAGDARYKFSIARHHSTTMPQHVRQWTYVSFWWAIPTWDWTDEVTEAVGQLAEGEAFSILYRWISASYLPSFPTRVDSFVTA